MKRRGILVGKMTVNKRKKNSRQRGSHTHGWGAKKKHRGSGNRGGKGRAGSGKRSDSKKPSNWNHDYFGKRGFIPKGPKIEIKAMNIKDIEENFSKLLSQKLIEEKNGIYSIDLTKFGYNKLLGAGRATKRFIINVPYASQKAIDKIIKAGGKVEGIIKIEKTEIEAPPETETASEE